MPDRPQSSNRWYQFSLRSALLGFALVGPVLGWTGAWLFRREAPEPVPVLGPLAYGDEPTRLDVPSDEEVFRAWKNLSQFPAEDGFWPPLPPEAAAPAGLELADVRIRKRFVSERTDPSRVYPMVGPARLHHAYYECTVQAGDRRYVVPVDHNHLHTDHSRP